MKILDFYIPSDLQSDGFIRSLHRQESSGKKLSKKQISALKNKLDVGMDFYAFEYVPPVHWKEDWHDLIEKLNANRFRTERGRNKVVRALNSIVNQNPDHYLIEDALGRGAPYYRR